MPAIESYEYLKKLLENKARMERLGITEIEMKEFYISCGPKARLWDEKLAALKSRFKLSPDDTAFVETVLVDNCYEKYKQKHGY